MLKKILISVISILIVIYLWDLGQTPVKKKPQTSQTAKVTPTAIMPECPERSYLDWDEFVEGLKVSPKAKIPKNYKLSVAFKDYLQFSTNEDFYEGKLTESEMNKFAIDYYLPSDCIVTNKETYFEERRRSNGTDYEITKYTLYSPYKKDDFTIEYHYPYDRNSKLALTFRYAILRKKCLY